MEVEGSEVQGCFPLRSELEASLGYKDFVLKREGKEGGGVAERVSEPCRGFLTGEALGYCHAQEEVSTDVSGGGGGAYIRKQSSQGMKECGRPAEGLSCPCRSLLKGKAARRPLEFLGCRL